MPTFDQIKKELSKYTVGIAGAGGLGSNIAMALTRVGIGRLIISDFDVVAESNLNRQFYFFDQINKKKVFALEQNLKRINSNINIEVHDILLNRSNIIDIYKDVDIMVEAFDKSEMKELIIEIFQQAKTNTPLVVGNGMAGWGDSNSIKVNQYGNLFICGDNESESSDNLPPMAPRVTICAAMQANVVVNLLLEKAFGKKPL